MTNEVAAQGFDREKHKVSYIEWYEAPGTGSYTYLDRIWEFLTAKGFNK